MLIGSNPPHDVPSHVPAPHGAEEVIFDVNAQDFEDRVMRASMDVPVLVDFWAPWCAPCMQMMPTLEAAVTAAGGKVLLAKVNLDENPELAQALRVQSVPMVFAFFNGQPINGFQGAQPESQIKAFIDQAIQVAREAQPEALNIPETLKAAADVMAEGNVEVAQGLYMQIMEQDENNAEAYAGLVRTFIAAETLEHAEEMIANVPDSIAKDRKFLDVVAALELAQKAPAGGFDDLIAAVDKAPDDQQAKLDLAEAQFASGEKAAAIETLLESIGQDRAWNEEAARKMLLTFFQALGHGDPLTVDARKRLSTLLFS
jgi:putative thioredoxin